MKKIIYSFILLAFAITNVSAVSMAAPVATPVKTQQTTVKVKPADTEPAINVSPLAIVNNPMVYLNKTVAFSGEFVSFTSLGLDYKPAFRDASKYIGILIKRPDVKEHTIPLSELKIFMSRELAEKNIDIEAGDTFSLTGKVFSTALGDPWMDITTFKITNKNNKDNKDNKAK